MKLITPIIRKTKSLLKRIVKRFQVSFASELYCDSYDHAYSVLVDYSPKPNSRAICEHNWSEPQYDLTIIIPAYNSEKWIDDCLQSALNQNTKYNYKVVVVDDGSTDSTAAIIDSYSNDEKLLIIHQDNKGYSGARNVALQKTASEYILFLDSDDYITLEAVERLLSVAKRENADIVESNGFTFNDSGKINTVKERNNVLWGGPCLKVMKSELWKNIEFPEGYIYEDTIISYLIGKKSSKTVFIDDELYAYRIHNNSITQKLDENPKRVDSFWILELVLSEQAALGLSNDSPEDYRDVMRHLIYTYRRTKILPEPIKKSIFVLTKELLSDKYFEYDYGNDLNRLSNALKADNYGKYCAICETINLSKI